MPGHELAARWLCRNFAGHGRGKFCEIDRVFPGRYQASSDPDGSPLSGAIPLRMPLSQAERGQGAGRTSGTRGAEGARYGPRPGPPRRHGGSQSRNRTRSGYQPLGMPTLDGRLPTSQEATAPGGVATAMAEALSHDSDLPGKTWPLWRMGTNRTPAWHSTSIQPREGRLETSSDSQGREGTGYGGSN
jgi:hypothetical protein